MRQEGRRRQHDVGHGGSLGEELLVQADEQVVAGEAAADGAGIGRDLERIGVLDVERRHRRRSEEHTSELQSLMRISYAVFCLKKKTKYIKRRREIKLLSRDDMIYRNKS